MTALTGRRGFLRSSPGADVPELDNEPAFRPGIIAGEMPFGRLGDPGAQVTPTGPGGSAAFDPIWGTLGAPTDESGGWPSRPEQQDDGVAIDVEIFGDGFHIAGQIRTGRFDRLSDWINMQTGFIRVWDASPVHRGDPRRGDSSDRKGELWVRLGQIAVVAVRRIVQQDRPGAPAVQKQSQKVSILTPGYSLRGHLHIHAHGSMKQFLETQDPHFLPITDVTVRGLADPEVVTRFPFAIVNREQLVTVLAEAAESAADGAQAEIRSA